MTLHRLAKWRFSCANGACPALYSDDETVVMTVQGREHDTAVMIAQGKKLTTARAAELEEMGEDEAAVMIPTETVFRSIALYLSEHGAVKLAGDIEEFRTAMGL
jgi:hypothetical protein